MWMEAFSVYSNNPGRLPDQIIVGRILAGEKGLFEILMRRNNQTLYRAVRSFLKQEDEIRDAMQDVYLKAYEKLEQFRGDASFTTWLVRIGINEALGSIRKEKKRIVLSFSSSQQQQSYFSQFSDTEAMNPEKKVINREVASFLEQAVDELPEKYRIVYILKEVDGMKNKEIANCLQLSESNVKVRLHRAKNLLKNRLLQRSTTTSIFEFGNENCDRLVSYVMGYL